MSEIVERVARALYEADAANSSVRWESWPDDRARARKGLRIKCGKYRDRARTAIKAIRLPTDAMIEAAGGPYINLERADNPSYEPQLVWEAMVDAAVSAPHG